MLLKACVIFSPPHTHKHIRKKYTKAEKVPGEMETLSHDPTKKEEEAGTFKPSIRVDI